MKAVESDLALMAWLRTFSACEARLPQDGLDFASDPP